MGKIKKAAGPKHEVTLSPSLAGFVKASTEIPLERLSLHLVTFPRRWPFPRGDLYHWIPLLNRFDSILGDFIEEYGLQAGPQSKPFGRELISRSENASKVAPTTEKQVEDSVGQQDDRELVESILNFSRMLMENCGNRSLYSSSDRLNDILNSTCLSLLSCALRLAVRLAQRYHVSRQRGANASQHLNNALLAAHYNIDIEKVQKLAGPIMKPSPHQALGTTTTSTTPTTKGKDIDSLRSSGWQSPHLDDCGDFVSLARMAGTDLNDHTTYDSKAKSSRKLEEWGRVSLSYYQAPVLGGEDINHHGISGNNTTLSMPTTPTPIRRPSALSRPSLLNSDETKSFPAGSNPVSQQSPVGGMKTFEISSSQVSSNSLTEILKATLWQIPKEFHYDLLCRLRIAKALAPSNSNHRDIESRRQILAIRILAITNIAYIYSEPTFQQKILQQDADQPRRLQLAYQLADLVHPPGNGGFGIPLGLQTLALGALEALSKHKSTAPDVCAALSVNVNHGVLFYILRKTVVDLRSEDLDNENDEGDEWRDALFSLLDTLPVIAPRTGETLMAAGLMDILVDSLTTRTRKAERNHPKVLTFLNSVVYTVRDAFQTFANSKGLEAISDLTAYEVHSSFENARNGQGLPEGFRNQVIDYKVPYFQQQTLRWVFKFVNHMMQHGSGANDRLLRNLIDSPQLLSGLRTVIVNAAEFGSNIWSGAVNILSTFIHNEPTSYGIIAEAGLSRGLLEAVAQRPIPVVEKERKAPEHDTDGHNDATADPSLEQIRDEQMLEKAQTHGKVNIVRVDNKPLARGIRPATDAIVAIPQAFGAICLNNSGLELFQASDALDSFFEIFESSEHVKSLSSEIDLPKVLGSAFDELVRHHPSLKKAVMSSVMIMIARVGYLCRSRVWQKGAGAKLWTEGSEGELTVSGGTISLLGDVRHVYGESSRGADSESSEDITMGEGSASEDVSVEQLLEHGRMIKLEDVIDKEDDMKELPVSTYINVAVKFLAGFFDNTSLCSSFVEAGGVEFVLDFATMPSLEYDFNNSMASQEIARVIHMLAEQKPHLVLPSLVRRTQKATDMLEPLMSRADGRAFFSQFTSKEPTMLDASKSSINGTLLVKSLVSVHTLCNILYETFSPPNYNPRSSHTVFSQVNLTDMYIRLVKSLGRLHEACVWEEILLQKTIPEIWKEATKIRGYSLGSDEANEIFALIAQDEPPLENGDTVQPTHGVNASQPGNLASLMPVPPTIPRQASTIKDDNTAQFKNVRSLRYLLSQIPSSITPFFQGLGKSLITKRRLEAYHRQSAYAVADALAETTVAQLESGLIEGRYLAECDPRDEYAYWIVILTSVSQLIVVEGPPERPQDQCLTLLLQAFKNANGLQIIQTLLEKFFKEITEFANSSPKWTASNDGAARLASAYGGIKLILTFYAQITDARYITEASQTLAISSERDRESPNYFSAAQFLVELRMAVLPVVRKLWDSDFVDKASSSIVKLLIETLKTILDSSHEHGAYKRSDKLPTRNKLPTKIFHVQRDKLAALEDRGYDKDMASEALYRCHNNQNAAEEYCKALQSRPRVPRNPIPSYDLEREKPSPPAPPPQRQDSEDTVPDLDVANAPQLAEAALAASLSSGEQSSVDPHVEVEETDAESNASRSMPPPPPAPGVPPEAGSNDTDGSMLMSIDNLLNQTNMLSNDEAAAIVAASSSNDSTPLPTRPGIEAVKLQDVVTLDDLEDERSQIRKNIIDRTLDVLNEHGDVTFELKDLIVAAAAKAADVSTMRREIGDTLVQSLISFQMDDDFRPAGKKIAAYANLLALVLQDRDFYEATLDELKSSFGAFLGFIRLFQDQNSDEPSPWIGQILLIAEKLLAEDVQPQQIKWTQPTPGDDLRPTSPLLVIDSLIPLSEKFQLFEAIGEILPRIGKDQSLALSVVRVLVILTRHRGIASRLAERRNLQRLFVMVKQLAGITNEKLQSSLMLILRHMVEDDETIRQIMRSEIVASFEQRPTRHIDTTAYVRQFCHLVLRSPEIFVDVTNDTIKLQRFDSNQMPQNLILKTSAREIESVSSTSGDATHQMSADGHIEHETNTDNVDLEEGNKDSTGKAKVVETKAPVVENPDGVVHYLLCELLSYKDVDDKEPEPPPKDLAIERRSSTSTDVQMGNDSTPPPPLGITPSADDFEMKKTDKPELKADQNPIHVYRCFILQCLTELLSCYNRTKIEFINFSRKADSKAMTPSKPRSGVLNYLLNAIIPIGTLNHEETIAFRKKSITSNWAMSVIVSLCLKTGEKGYSKRRSPVEEEEEEPDLLFVRKFVLEHSLKAYKDANNSSEPPDVKYARMLCIADLFNRMLSGKLLHTGNSSSTEVSPASQKQIAKIMFEKNFISALTSSIADIDLNFPASKRAVKYILRPLKHLTQTAIVLSESSSISSTPGQTDDDEISSATSVSDMEDLREETPDLFRNSTLGMFEPGRGEESSSESSDEDEDMYDDDGYGEDMDYEEEVERDGDEVISDEEEMAGAGHIEGMPGDVGMEVEVVIDGDEDEDNHNSSEDDDDDDEPDDMDDADDVEIIDEINGDNENESLTGGEDEEWQDEEEGDEGYEEERIMSDDLLRDPQDPENIVREMLRDFPREPGEGDIHMDIGGEEYMEDVMHGEDDDGEDDDEDDMDEEEDVMYHPRYEDDQPSMPDPPWEWDPDDDPRMPMPRGHHHRPHRIGSPWSILPGGPSDRDIILPGHVYRSHRPTAPRGNDDGTNPLLQRSDSASGNPGVPGVPRPVRLTDAAANMSDWVHAMDAGQPGRGVFPMESPVSFVNNIISAIGQGQGGPGFAAFGGPQGGMHLHIAGGTRGGIPRELQSMLGLRRRPLEMSRSREDSTQSASFVPRIVCSTVNRWQEEARLLYGTQHIDKALRLVNTLLRVLVPPALEEEKIRKEKEREDAQKAKLEHERKQAEEERVAKEEAEKQAQEKQQQDERETIERAVTTQEDASNLEEPSEGQVGPSGEEIDGNAEGAMEGIETAQDEQTSSIHNQTSETPAGQATGGGTAAPIERVRTVIRGRELDITDLGIDLGYLEGLPEDLREEVLMQQLTVQRTQVRESGQEITDISREFLEALPPDIREEVLQVEARDRRQREGEERRRRAAANGGPPAAGAQDMDTASFFASLPPSLRQTVLLDQNEDVLAQLPQAIIAEARALGNDGQERMIRHFRGDGIERFDRADGFGREGQIHDQTNKKSQRKQVVQMLDKAGVATLLRLMFVPQQGSSRQSLNGILHDVSQNRQNRAEVVSLLLSILQDGSADTNAVERSFAHLSLRAKQPTSQKTPQIPKRSLTESVPQTTNSEMTPLMVIQQCLAALVFLTQYNAHIPSFFLTEHETSSGLKSKSSRKGKGKESRATKFALNALLGLLDRKLIMESSSCMEQLSSLLQSVTHPLTILLRKEKDTSDMPEVAIEPPPDQVSGAPASVVESINGPESRTISEDIAMTETSASQPENSIQNSARRSVEAPLTTIADSGGSAKTEDKVDEAKTSEDNHQKKPRALTPPVVPEYNLRLVVTILAARECSAKTFRDTLSTINNLSAIPQAKQVFGEELVQQAQDLGDAILNDLDELVLEIQKARFGTDIQGIALAKFSPSSSDQSKLLRVLTALDYLFDPKRNDGKVIPPSEAHLKDTDSTSKENFLAKLYASHTFSILWVKLSDSLSAIRQRENMLNVATILLPLIEALMVVCKNTTLEDAPFMKISKPSAITSSSLDSGIENLFFRFTEDHRKILNDLVRHNPKLMSGTFSLLIKNPKVLEFDNKRNYFTRRLHSRGTEARNPQPPLQLSVRRDHVFFDSFKSLYFKSGEEMKYGKLNIRFHGEEGVDAGGVTREWFQVLSRQMFNPDYALFVPVASDRTTFHPNKRSGINEEHMLYFKFIGNIIGKALYEGRALDCHFSRAVYKRILGKSVSIKDMETLDLQHYKSLLWMLENDITDIITETFSDETEAFGVTETYDLIENGRNIPVTEENKQEYVQLIVENRLTGSVQDQLAQFLKGFHAIVPSELISIFNEQELELLISGLPDIDVDDWKNNTDYHQYSVSSPQIQWFWRAVRSFDKEERAKLLQFVTGTSKVPLNGFKELEGMNGFSRFNIHRDYGNKDRLPSSHTCFNQLDLPEYDSYETLRQQVYTAMTAGSEYFGFA